MFLKNLGINALKYRDLILITFLSAPGLAWQVCLKKTNINLELLTYVDADMLLMIEAGSRGGMCQSTHGYAEANNKYMKN